MNIPIDLSIRNVSYNGVNIPLVGGGSDINVEEFSTTVNGTFTAPSGKAYSPVTVNVPTGTARSSSDVTVSGATVTVPSGLYNSQVQKSVTSGTAGTPTASKSISGSTATITPSVTNTTGYITGSTKTGTAVTVTASELDTLGTKEISENCTGMSVVGYSTIDVNVPNPSTGNKAITATTTEQTGIDVTNYATVSVAPTPSETKNTTSNGTITPSSGKLLSSVTVNVPTGTARSSTDVTVSGATVTVPSGLYDSQVQKSVANGGVGSPTISKSISGTTATLTPSVTSTTGYITGETKSGSNTTVTAAELDTLGSKSIISNGNVDVTGYSSVSVNVPVPMNVQYNATVAKITNKSSYTSTGVSITVEKTGTYKCSWIHYAYASSSSYYLTRLYVNNSAVGSTHSSPAYNGSSGWVATENSLSLTAGQTVTVYARTRSGSSYYTVAGMLVIEQTA